jgi:hypothetical protein
MRSTGGERKGIMQLKIKYFLSVTLTLMLMQIVQQALKFLSHIPFPNSTQTFIP